MALSPGSSVMEATCTGARSVGGGSSAGALASSVAAGPSAGASGWGAGAGLSTFVSLLLVSSTDGVGAASTTVLLGRGSVCSGVGPGAGLGGCAAAARAAGGLDEPEPPVEGELTRDGSGGSSALSGEVTGADFFGKEVDSVCAATGLLDAVCTVLSGVVELGDA